MIERVSLHIAPLWRHLAAIPLAGRVVTSLAFRVAGTALSLIATIIIARTLGHATYGDYIYWISIAGLATVFSVMGTPTLIMREIAAARGSDDLGRIWSAVTFGSKVTIVFATVVIFVGIGTALQQSISNNNATMLTQPILFVGLIVAVNLGVGLANAVILGFEQIALSLMSPILQQMLQIVIFGTIYLLSMSIGTPQALLMTFAANAAIMMLLVSLSIFVLRKISLRNTATIVPSVSVRNWLFAGFFIMINQIMSNAQTQIDVIMLGTLGESEDIASYFASSRGAYILTFLFGALTVAIGPVAARLHAAGQREELANVLSRSGVSVFAVTLVVSVLMTLLGPWFLGLFGKGFENGYVAFVILIIGWIVCIGCGTGQTVLIMTGHQKISALVFAAGLGLNVVLNLALIPPFGSAGAALATAVSVAAIAFAAAIICPRLVGCRVDALAGLVDVLHAWRSSRVVEPPNS